MRTCAWQMIMVSLLSAAVAGAAPHVELELATERGLQITAPHEWLQLLTAIGVDQVRIRGAQPGDEPKLSNRGGGPPPRYHVVGILTARDELRLPGGTFGRRDRARLRDYFDNLAADGPEGIIAPRGRFGLTEQQLQSAFADLSQPIDFETGGQRPRAILDQLQAKFSLRLAIDPAAGRALDGGPEIKDEVRGLTAGTGLAILLRRYRLVLRPEKPRGGPVVHRIRVADAEAMSRKSLGETGDRADRSPPDWPVGWAPEQLPRTLAPVLFEFLNAEIDGYTLEEALGAIGPRVKVPYYFDHALLAVHKIDPTAIKVSLPRSRTYYKRVIDRLLAQARLGGEIRIDEAGTPFLWITR